MNQAAPTIVELVAEGVLDAELAALLWLLTEGGVPLTVTGPVSLAGRVRVARAVLAAPPEVPWVLVDADQERPGLATLGARIRGGVRVGITIEAADLRSTLERLSAPPDGLPEDAVRRLGIVLVTDVVPSTAVGPVSDRIRVVAAHYLRPLERDAAGHVQRRPPAVLATWAPATGFDHFAWGLTPELADQVDRTQASFEELQASRAAAIGAIVAGDPADTAATLDAVRAAEPPRQPAQAHGVARPFPVRSPLRTAVHAQSRRTWRPRPRWPGGVRPRWPGIAVCS